MLNPVSRAHLPAIQFSPRAYMGCGGWDLAQAPETVAPSLEAPARRSASISRAYTRPQRAMGECPIIVYEPLDEEEKANLSGRPRVRMGCGDELCEECEAKRQAGIGCAKCKRIRKRAMMQQELEGTGLGQVASYSLPSLVTGGLVVFGLFYLATR